MKAFYTDTHCHLDFPVFDHDRELILQHCHEKNIQAIIVPGVEAKYWSRVLSLCGRSGLFPALGLHPCFQEKHQPRDLQLLRQLCKENNLAAIGEIGLDFYIKTLDRDTQRYYFSQQLEIASEYHLPVLIHARKSHSEVIKLLKSYPALKGIIHAYSGSYEQAVEFLKLGFKLGFGGAYTYPRAHKLRSMVTKLPLDAWVLETDAPDMTPISHYKQRNSPEYLPEIAAELFSLSDDAVAEEPLLTQLEVNTRFIFPEIV